MRPRRDFKKQRHEIRHPGMRGAHNGATPAHMVVAMSGAHELHLHLTAGRHPIDYTLTRQQVAELRHVLDAFEREAEWADEGADLTHDRFVRLVR